MQGLASKLHAAALPASGGCTSASDIPKHIRGEVRACAGRLQVTLVAVNANGNSPATGPVAFTAPILTPDSPKSVAVSPTGLVSFLAPINTGASPIAGYIVTAFRCSSGTTSTVQGSSSPLQLGGLVERESYMVRVG